MITLIIYAFIELIALFLLSFLIHGVWIFFIPILSFVVIISGFAWIKRYRLVAQQFNKPKNFTDEEYAMSIIRPAITFTRVDYGFRIPEVSAMNGWIQLLLVGNLVLSLIRMDILSFIITLILMYFANFTYSSKIPGTTPQDDLRRIFFAFGIPDEQAKIRIPNEVTGYVELINKLREHFHQKNKNYNLNKNEPNNKN